MAGGQAGSGERQGAREVRREGSLPPNPSSAAPHAGVRLLPTRRARDGLAVGAPQRGHARVQLHSQAALGAARKARQVRGRQHGVGAARLQPCHVSRRQHARQLREGEGRGAAVRVHARQQHVGTRGGAAVRLLGRVVRQAVAAEEVALAAGHAVGQRRLAEAAATLDGASVSGIGVGKRALLVALKPGRKLGGGEGGREGGPKRIHEGR